MKQQQQQPQQSKPSSLFFSLRCIIRSITTIIILLVTIGNFYWYYYRLLLVSSSVSSSSLSIHSHCNYYDFVSNHTYNTTSTTTTTDVSIVSIDKNTNTTTYTQKDESDSSSLLLYDWNTIRYISGEFGWDSNFDQLIWNQCYNQSGYEINAERYHNDYCAGPIYHPIQCCYCYYHVYPTFINEEIIIQHNTKNNNQHSIQQNWESHLSLLNLTKVIDITNSNTNNSYIHQHTEGRASYYFCMEPRTYSIPVEQMNSTYLRTKNIFNNNNNQRFVLVTGKFGYNNTFQKVITKLCQKAKASHLYDMVHCHYDDHLFLSKNDRIRFERHRQYLYNETDESAKGGGFWFHKAIMIRYYMDFYNDNDYILYSDPDYVKGLEVLGLYKTIEVMVERNADIVLEILGSIEQEWTKEDILASFHANTAIRESYQVWGGMQLLRNTPAMRKFYDAIINCNTNYHMISDEPSTMEQQPPNVRYRENRHDQSILSLFYKTFLSNQTVIGPPVQPYYDLNRYTFQLHNTTKVYCPFTKN